MRTCDFGECGRPHSRHGLCQGHAVQRQKGQPLRPLRVRLGDLESVPQCQVPRRERDVATNLILCPGHVKAARGYSLSPRDYASMYSDYRQWGHQITIDEFERTMA